MTASHPYSYEVLNVSIKVFDKVQDILWTVDM